MLFPTLFISVVMCVFGNNVNTKEYREVRIGQGVLRGYKNTDFGIYVFYGIPYATAPKGQHRYRAPLPAPVWSGTLEAIANNIVCPQDKDPMKGLDIMNHKTSTEDCLIANIYAPDTKDQNLPVVVYVHAGAFAMGSGNLLTPKNFVKNNQVMVVTFNYRIGALGYLCLGTEDIPGNAGMKDQVALLRWVKNNIANFGGNPNDVTLAGYSSGAMSVDLLMLSKMTDGLFTKVIPESGYNLGSYALQNEPIEQAKQFAKRRGFYNVDDFHALHDFFMNSSVENLLEEVIITPDASPTLSPCVERHTSEEPFLSEAPYTILKTGNYKKVPLLYGITTAEGLLQVPLFKEFSKQMNENFASVLPSDLKFDNDSQKAEVAALVKKFYFKDENITSENIAAYVYYFTDIYFGISFGRALQLHVAAGHKEIYVYEYSYVDDKVVMFSPNPLKVGKLGADHCAQSFAVLEGLFVPDDESKLTKQFIEMKSLMRGLWYNFITTKKPVPVGSALPNWPAVGKDYSPHMSINTTMELRGPILKERLDFWEKIYDKHYKIPTAPAYHGL